MAKTKLVEFIGGYTTADKNSSGKKFAVELITGSANKVSLTRAGKHMARFFERFTKIVSYTSSRAYGALFCAFGSLSLAIHFVLDYLGVYDTLPLSTLIISVAFALLSIPFLVSDKPLSVALQDNPITDFIFFEFFCIRRMHKGSSEKGVPITIGVIIGVLLSVLGAFVPLWAVALGIAAAIYLFLTFLSPEFSFFSIFLIMPYLSFDTDGVFLAALVAITFISYARKVASGKRVYYLEQYDIALSVMLFCIR